MRRDYPLNALRAFEASARHLSFARAAAELHVTPAAISHQVKNLEDYLATPLFRRMPRGLRLLESGRTLSAELHDIFGRLDKAVDEARAADAHGALTISVAPMFAVKWLLPRLGSFDARHPEIDLRISSSLGLVDFQRDDFDAAVRLGRGQYPGLRSKLLFEEFVTPMCSPRLLDDGSSQPAPQDLLTRVLLHDDSMSFDAESPTWSRWLKAAGVRTKGAMRGPRFSQPDHALQAAIDGAGIALGWCSLADRDLIAGRLVAPFDVRLPLGSAFYLVYPEAYAEMAKIVALKDWMLEELGPD